jgi:drug/metabolite transporter (DMT)-like permease
MWFSLWGWVAAYTTPTVMTSYLAVQPMIAVTLGAITLGESLGWDQVIGAFGILVGLVLVIYARHKELEQERVDSERMAVDSIK